MLWENYAKTDVCCHMCVPAYGYSSTTARVACGYAPGYIRIKKGCPESRLLEIK